MSELLELTTELDAVNAILGAVGESPINDFDDNFTDASIARNLLRQESRRFQAKGWTFNTEVGVVLSPANDGSISLPRNTLQVKLQDTTNNIVQRGFRLYDRTAQSYVFTETQTVDLVLALNFEEMPETARQYITIKAGRMFQDQYQGDDAQHRFKARDEVAAWAAWQNYEAEVAKHNVLSNFALITRIKGGR